MSTRDRDLALARVRHPLKDESGREGYADGCEHTRELIAADLRKIADDCDNVDAMTAYELAADRIERGEYLPADAEQGGR